MIRRRIIIPIILLLSLFSRGEAAYLDLAWDANQESDLTGYRVYYGTSSREYINYVDVGNVTTYRLDGLLENARFYIAVTAYDWAGNESTFSEEVSGVSLMDDASGGGGEASRGGGGG